MVDVEIDVDRESSTSFLQTISLLTSTSLTLSYKFTEFQRTKNPKCVFHGTESHVTRKRYGLVVHTPSSGRQGGGHGVPSVVIISSRWFGSENETLEFETDGIRYDRRG